MSFEQQTHLPIDGFTNQPDVMDFPSTRYQGSKYKLLEWIHAHTYDLNFNTVLDAFGGSASVSYLYKKIGKHVVYNDILRFNYYIGQALVENSATRISHEDLAFLMRPKPEFRYRSLIYDTFQHIYFTDEENRWLDMVVQNIALLSDPYKQSMAYFALFQACIIKRPYNLFHRKNLYVRTAEVARSFGNKKTWDTPFPVHFEKFITQANAAVFDNHKHNYAWNKNVFDIHPAPFDLIYIDPPYIALNGSTVDYYAFYHFLEGLTMYDTWDQHIDYTAKHRKLMGSSTHWHNKHTILHDFDALFAQFKESILVVSYRDDGIPTISDLIELLHKYKRNVVVHTMDYKYALSITQSKEVLLIAT